MFSPAHLDSAAAEPHALRQRAAFWLIFAVGIALRLRAYLFDRALWLDELFLWSTLGEPRLARAFEPLGEGQVVAPGFALLSQIVRSLFSDTELALRAPALAAGIVAIPLAHALFSRAVSRFAGLVAAALVAVSPHAVYYSADFKPYSLDLVVALAVMFEAWRVAAGERAFAWWRALVYGSLAVFVSLPAPLVLGGCGLVLLGRAWRTGDRRQLTALVLVATAWLAVFAAQYLTLLRHHHADPLLHEYWVNEGAFPRPTIEGALSYVPVAIQRALSNPAGFGDEWGRVRWSTHLAAAFFVVGIVVIFRRRSTARFVLLAPLAIALLAGATQRYPFSGRVLCFLVPSLVLPVLLALSELRSAFRGGRFVAIVVAALLLSQASLGGWRRVVAPLTREEARDVIRDLSSELRAGDVVYLSYWGRFAWRYYSPRFALPAVTVVEAPWIPVDRVTEYRADVAARLPRNERVWFFITHFYPENDERRVVLNTLEGAGARVVATLEAPAAAAHRLDLGAFAP
jgi:Dolichyl-phosphate-mannose-protein mannosyltransferase